MKLITNRLKKGFNKLNASVMFVVASIMVAAGITAEILFAIAIMYCFMPLAYLYYKSVRGVLINTANLYKCNW